MRQRTLGLLAAALMLVGAVINVGAGIAAQQMGHLIPGVRHGGHPNFPGPLEPATNNGGPEDPGTVQPGGQPQGDGNTGP